MLSQQQDLVLSEYSALYDTDAPKVRSAAR